MSPVQTTYSDRIGLPTPGSVHGTDSNVETGICETEAGIGFGLAVSQGAHDQGVVLGGALAGFRGITVKDITVGTPASPELQDKYPEFSNVAVLTRGFIYVQPTVAVSPGDPVHYDTSTGAFTNTGGIGPITGARWASSGDASTPALVQLSGFNQ